MTGPARIAAFAAVVALASGGAAAAGSAIDPKGADESAPAGHNAGHETQRGDEHMTSTATNNSHEAAASGDDVRGLAVADDGLRIVADTPSIERGEGATVAFRIVDDEGKTVRDFDVQHEKRMHLILARRDLTGFQHLHPEQRPDGSWTAPVRIEDAGSYRLFADFAREGEAQTLATDISVDGPADLRGLPPENPLAKTAGGYEVKLNSGTAHAGEEAELDFEITKNGQAVEVEEYLGAGGHLVALREGDLAFLHVHPEDDGVRFMSTFPTVGRYRLFLQFKHEGRIQTAAFTKEVK